MNAFGSSNNLSNMSPMVFVNLSVHCQMGVSPGAPVPRSNVASGTVAAAESCFTTLVSRGGSVATTRPLAVPAVATLATQLEMTASK